MKSLKLLLLSLSLIFSISVASAQNTTVSGTVTDPDGTAWANGNITFTLVGSGGPPFTCSGTQLTPNQVRVNLVLNGSGAFTGSLCSNSNVTPVNSQWQIVVCSATTAPCQNLNPTTVSGGSQSLTTFINNQLQAIRMSPVFGSRAYNDTEIISPLPGTQYYSLSLNAIRVFNGTVWQTVSAGALLAWPMNDGSGLVFNTTIGSDPATLTSGGLGTWQTNAGFPGTTFNFNDTGSAITTSPTLVDFKNSQPFSIGFWTGVNASTNGSTFVSTITNSAPFTGWEIATIGAAGGSIFEFYLINNYPSNAINVSAPRPDGSVKNIVVTYSGAFNGTRYPASDVSVYYNGVLQTLTVGADTLTGDPRSGQPLRIGGRTGSVAFMSGPLGFIEIWPFVLSQPTIASNFAKGPAIY